MIRQIIFRETGNPLEVLEPIETAITLPSENEIRVKVMARPVNPSDEMFIKGVYRLKPAFPQAAGLEGAGIIEQTGANVDPSLIGKHVSFRAAGTWADKINLPLNKIRIIPDTIPFETACQLSLNTLTAYALLQETNLAAGKWLLLNAANSSVGKQVIQMAAAKGIQVIAVVRKDGQKEPLQQLGAHYVINTEKQDLVKEVLSIIPTGVNAILDAVGGEQGSLLYKVLAPFASIIIYGRLSSNLSSYSNGDIIYKNASIKGFGIDAWLQQKTKQELDEAWAYILKNIATGKLIVPYDKQYALADFKKALTEYQTNATRIILN